MDDLQSDKLWSPTTPVVTDLQKTTGKKNQDYNFFWVYGVLNALSHKIELGSKVEELTGGGVHEAWFQNWKKEADG